MSKMKPNKETRGDGGKGDESTNKQKKKKE